MTADDNLIARWARRKAEVAKAEQASTAPQDMQPSDDRMTGEEESFDLAALPSLDDITAQTDIRPFMHRLVPADLRNAALRRMWELDPAIRDYVSPATEYAWDFNAGGGAPGYGPLEAGFDAVKAAARMLSSENGRSTLVDSAEQDQSAAALADAKGGKVSASPDRIAAQTTFKLETVRISTKSEDGGEQLRPSAGVLAGPEAEQMAASPCENDAASQQFRIRHGGATPR